MTHLGAASDERASLRINKCLPLTLYEEVENVLTNRLKNALRTGEVINAPGWVSDLARCLALAVVLVEETELPRLTQFAHTELDRCIANEWQEKQQRDRS